jgi:hypothetical protein
VKIAFALFVVSDFLDHIRDAPRFIVLNVLAADGASWPRRASANNVLFEKRRSPQNQPTSYPRLARLRSGGAERRVC